MTALTTIEPKPSTVHVVFATLRIVKMVDHKFKLPDDWNQFVKSAVSKEKRILSGISKLADSIDVLHKNRIEIMRMKTQCLGKGKIVQTTISSSYQKESRPFVNLLALIVLALKYLKQNNYVINSNNVVAVDNNCINEAKASESSN